MPDYTRRLRERTRQRQEFALKCEAFRREIGATVAEFPMESRPADSQQIYDRIATVRKNIAETNTTIARLDQIRSRHAELDAVVDRLRRESEDIETDLAPVFEQIGTIAFRLFREHPLIDSTYSTAFEELSRHQDEVRGIEREIDQIKASQPASKGFVERVMLQGRDLLLRNRLSSREHRLPAILRRTGSQLSNTDFISQMDDPELNRVARLLEEARDRQAELSKTIEASKDEYAALADELEQLTGGKRPARARSDFEAGVRTAQENLANAYGELGTLAEQQQLEVPGGVMAALREATARIAELDRTINRLESGLQAIAAADESKRLRARLQSTNEQIERLHQQRETLGEQIAANEALHARLVESRGDENELFAID